MKIGELLLALGVMLFLLAIVGAPIWLLGVFWASLVPPWNYIILIVAIVCTSLILIFVFVRT